MSGSILRPVNTARFLSRVIGTVLLLTISGIAYLQAQVVRGQVVDSITLVPIDGGTVTLISADGSEVGRTRTNSEGLFLIQAGAAGQFHLRAEAEGYRLSEFPPFQLETDQLATYMLLVPSIDPQPSMGLTPMLDDWDPDAVAAQVCPEDTPDNLPVVLGVVRDAMTQEPVVDAEIRISWPAVSGILRERVDLDDTEGWAISGDGGLYGICGLPVDSRIAAYAVEGNRISEVVSVTFEWGGVFSGVYTGGGFKEMPGRAWRQDFELRPVTMRTASIIGTVMDSGGISISNAVVSIAGTPFTTRTNVTGAFRLAGLPPGDMRVFAQRLGYEPVRIDVQLNEGETVSLPPFQLGGAPTVLDPVAVEAEVGEARRSLPEFERRRETTSGYFVTREEFEQQGLVDEVIDILRRAPGMYIRRGTSALEWIITTRRGSMRGGLRDFDTNPCYPLVFVDRSYIGTTGTVDVNREISAHAIEAVEVYSSAVAVPQEFNRVGAVCGAIVFWTR